jgi:hypothetical protein
MSAPTPAASPATLPLPDDEVMAAFLALATGQEMFLNPTTGEMLVVLSPGKAAFVEGWHLDELFLREWIEADDDTKVVRTTERGAYWLNRWLKQNRRKS